MSGPLTLVRTPMVIGVVVNTNDTTCTVPAFPEGGAVMPSTFAEGAEEGYVEIIAMAQPLWEGQSLPVAAEHDDGVPLSLCNRSSQLLPR